MRILGLDPGLALMGGGVISIAGTKLDHVAHGVIATKAADGLGPRLMRLHAGRRLLGKHRLQESTGCVVG